MDVRRLLRRASYREGATEVLEQSGAALFYYVERSKPGWVKRGTDLGLRDTIHHLVVVVRRENGVAIYCSENGASDAIARALKKSTGAYGATLKRLALARPAELERAFARGNARTLWLNSIQVRSEIRPDAKVLSGSDLEHALDSYGDQGYAFSAARCATDSGDARGVNPSRARVWVGRTDSLATFVDGATSLLADLEQAQDEPAGFLTTLSRRGLDEDAEGAFDISVLPPAAMRDESERDEAGVLERTAAAWADASSISIASAFERDLRVAIDGEDCAVDMTLRDGSYEVSCAGGGSCDKCRSTRRILSRGDWVTVRYESGYSVFGGSVWEMKLRDQKFPGFEWPSLDTAQFDVTEEKPRDISKKTGRLAPTLSVPRLENGSASEGLTLRSLFSWLTLTQPVEVLGTQGGWLACDDRGKETADFLYVGPDKETLSLIHVKAGGTTGNLSVPAFEVVTAQALKNLRWLETVDLVDEFGHPKRKRLRSLVWKNGVRQPDGTDEFVQLLTDLPLDAERRVVVVQPGLSDKGWNKADPAAARLLNTLLLGAAATCRQHNATLVVCGRSDP